MLHQSLVPVSAGHQNKYVKIEVSTSKLHQIKQLDKTILFISLTPLYLSKCGSYVHLKCKCGDVPKMEKFKGSYAEGFRPTELIFFGYVQALSKPNICTNINNFGRIVYLLVGYKGCGDIASIPGAHLHRAPKQNCALTFLNFNVSS